MGLRGDLLAKEMLRLTASADIFLKLSADDLFQLSKSEAADDTCWLCSTNFRRRRATM